MGLVLGGIIMGKHKWYDVRVNLYGNGDEIFEDDPTVKVSSSDTHQLVGRETYPVVMNLGGYILVSYSPTDPASNYSNRKEAVEACLAAWDNWRERELYQLNQLGFAKAKIREQYLKKD